MCKTKNLVGKAYDTSQHTRGVRMSVTFWSHCWGRGRGRGNPGESAPLGKGVRGGESAKSWGSPCFVERRNVGILLGGETSRDCVWGGGKCWVCLWWEKFVGIILPWRRQPFDAGLPYTKLSSWVGCWQQGCFWRLVHSSTP
jgi:hypothetical protein